MLLLNTFAFIGLVSLVIMVLYVYAIIMRWIEAVNNMLDKNEHDRTNIYGRLTKLEDWKRLKERTEQ